MNVWRLMTHHSEPIRALIWTRKREKVAIGWGGEDVGNLIQPRYYSPDEIRKGILASWPTSHNATQGGKQLWNFAHTMKVGDLVILSAGGARALTVQIKGEYEWADEDDIPIPDGDYRHQRSVILTHFNPDTIWKMTGGRPIAGDSIRWTLIRCHQPLDETDLRLL